MLILSRKIGETLMIGDDITITICGIKNNQIRIGIKAPDNVKVHRQEIYERIKMEEQGQVKIKRKPKTTAPETSLAD